MTNRPDDRTWTGYKYKRWHTVRLAVLMFAGASGAIYSIFHHPGRWIDSRGTSTLLVWGSLCGILLELWLRYRRRFFININMERRHRAAQSATIHAGLRDG